MHSSYKSRDRGPAPNIGTRCGACLKQLNQCWACHGLDQAEERNKKKPCIEIAAAPTFGAEPVVVAENLAAADTVALPAPVAVVAPVAPPAEVAVAIADPIATLDPSVIRDFADSGHHPVAAAAAADTAGASFHDRSQWSRTKISLRQVKSLIWRSLNLGFSKYPISKQGFQHLVICEKCASCADTAVHCEIDYGLSKSTSNIKSHVAAHHKTEYDAFLLNKSKPLLPATANKSITNFFEVSSSLKSVCQKSNEVTQLLKLIVCNH